MLNISAFSDRQKLRFQGIGIALMLTTGAFGSSHLCAQIFQPSSGSSYPATVIKLQQSLEGGLQQISRCDFYTSNPALHFIAADLSPNVTWTTPSTGSIRCAVGKACLHTSPGHARQGDPAADDVWEFRLKEDADSKEVEAALIHLIDLCSVYQPGRNQ